jgi:transcriptional regulator with XRE-family HTH domain
MAISPSSSVRQAREALAQRLREIRLDAGLTARALALAAGWHESKCSRIEHVRTAPSEADIRLWCRICGAGDQAADLIASSRAADSMYTEWRRLEATGLRHLQESLVPLYERTKRFRAYQSHVVPGLFQTPVYAAALLAAISAFRGVPDDSERAAGARAERSRVLYDQDRRFEVVIEEAVLRYQVGSAEVMAGQFGHLLSVISVPWVSVEVIPFTVRERPMWAVEGFLMFDDVRVDAELLSARVTVTQPREIAIYDRAFSALSAMAAHGQEARALITRAITALG